MSRFDSEYLHNKIIKEKKKKLMKIVLTGKLESHREIFRGESERKKNKLIKRIKKFLFKRKNA